MVDSPLNPHKEKDLFTLRLNSFYGFEQNPIDENVSYQYCLWKTLSYYHCYSVTPSELARNGFIYTGKKDKAVCVYCWKF